MDDEPGWDDLTEQQGFTRWCALALARDPEQAVRLITQAFPESKVRAALAVVSREPHDRLPQPHVVPDGPRAESCDWCGRSQPDGGLVVGYDRPPQPVLEVDEATLEARHVPAEPCPRLNFARLQEYPHCAREDECQQARDEQIDSWRDHQYGVGWRQPQPEPAWLTREREQALVLLTSAQAAGYALLGWVAVQGRDSPLCDAERTWGRLRGAERH
jgi:hypothetical protein